MYEKGFGVDQDQKKAVAMYKEAAMQGNLKSQYNLGLKYQVGEGVEQDNSKAFEWFQTARRKGSQKRSSVWASCTSRALPWARTASPSEDRTPREPTDDSSRPQSTAFRRRS